MACGIFIYLFHLSPPEKVWLSLSYLNVPAFTCFAIFYFVFVFIVDSWVTQKVLNKFSYPVKFSDILCGRGATYLIMVISYPASQAAFAYYLKKKYGIKIFEALGIFLFIVFIDLLWIVTLAFAGSFSQDYSVTLFGHAIGLGRTVQIFSIIAYTIAFMWISFWHGWPNFLVGRIANLKIVSKIKSRSMFNIFNKARIGDYIRTAVMRIPIHFMIITSVYIILLTFNVSIPFTKILGNIPIVFFIGALPITPGGLGTTNLATAELLSPYISSSIFAEGKVSPYDLIIAMTLLWEFANYLLKFLVGLLFLSRASSDLFKPADDDVSEEEVERQAPHVGGNI